jgi:hypothetical protein
MRCIQVVNGMIENIVQTDPESLPPMTDGSSIVASESGNVGDSYANGVVTPQPAAPSVPVSVALWQAKTALSNAGLLTAAESAVAAANNPALALFWEDASNIERGDPLVATIGAALGLTPAQVDLLFIAAAQVAL